MTLKILVRKIIVRTTLAVLMGLSGTNAYGAELFYVPASMDISIDAGSRVTLPLTVGLTNGGARDYRLFFLNSIKDGNLPLEWLQVFPSLSFLSNAAPSDSTEVTIGVPSETPSGTYSGWIVAMAAGPQGPADPGTGVKLSVRVSNRCGRIPSFEIDSFGPENAPPGGRRNAFISISGKITMPEGCTLSDARYRLDDEFGQYSGQGAFSMDKGNGFVLRIPVGGSRKRNDPDGRSYTVRLYAGNELGGTTRDINIFVPRDLKK